MLGKREKRNIDTQLMLSQCEPDLGTGRERISEWLRGRAMALAIFCLSLILTVFVWHQADRHIEQRNQDRFGYRIEEVKYSIEERMLEYEQVLRDGVAFWNASNYVSRDEWRDYVKMTEIREYFPGIQAIGLSLVVPKEERDELTNNVRREGFPEYRIYPEGDRDNYTAIIYIEPFDQRNQLAFGYDMYSESVRREAMDRAARTGKPAISGKITLVQETGDDFQFGVLCYLPLYERGANVSDERSRKAALKGWVYAAFRMNDLMRGILGDVTNDIAYRIYDTGNDSEIELLYESCEAAGQPPRGKSVGFFQSHVMPMSGRDWEIDVTAKEGFFSATDDTIRPMVAISGLVIDVLLFLVVSSIGRQRSAAIKYAKQMTEDLHDSESRTRSILENATDAIVSVDSGGRVSVANDAANWMFSPLAASGGNAELVGVRFGDLIEDMSFAGVIEAGVRSRKNASDSEDGIAVRCRRDDGSLFPCRMSIGVVEGGDGYIVVARDETARFEFEKELAETNRQLVKASHKAGMAEVATGVLHDVGNSINGVSTSSNLIAAMLDDSAVPTLSRAIGVMNEHREDLPGFFAHHRQGKHLPEFLTQIESTLRSERERLIEENLHLGSHVGHINQIIRAQQDEACSSIIATREFASELMEQAALVNLGRHAEFDITLERDLDSTVTIETDRNKVLQILINFVANAQDAVREVNDRPRRVRLSTRVSGDQVEFSVVDNGPGIAPDVLPKLMEFGFTTKSDGHGFGLHSCDLTAKELQGELRIKNNESGHGACFTLALPLELDSEPGVTSAAVLQRDDDQNGDRGDQTFLPAPCVVSRED